MKLGRGFFAIGIQNTKTVQNIGTLWRSASILGAQYIFTVGARYKHQSSDTLKSWKHIPLFHYLTMEELLEGLPHDCLLVGVELDQKSIPVTSFSHPERCVYLLGAEDNGLTPDAIKTCHKLVQLPGDKCMNVAVAGSLIMYDRWIKG